jgi:hypothetical protein
MRILTFTEYVGGTRRHLLAFSTFPVIQYGGRKTGNLFFHRVFRITSAVNLLLGYKIHYTDHFHVFVVLELSGAIKKAALSIFWNQKRQIQDGGCQNRMYLYRSFYTRWQRIFSG